MQATPSTSLVRAWSFRIVLLVMSLAGFFGMAVNTYDRLQLSTYGVNASIERVGKSQLLPTAWSYYEGRERAPFAVNLTDQDGSRHSTTLFLSKEVIEALLRGEKASIVHAPDNLRRHVASGDPLPSFGIGWLVLGLVLFPVFLYSLKLR